MYIYIYVDIYTLPRVKVRAKCISNMYILLGTVPHTFEALFACHQKIKILLLDFNFCAAFPRLFIFFSHYS